jgi:hypothetical protein
MTFGGGAKRCVETNGEVASNRCKLLEDGESDRLLGIMLMLSVKVLDATNDLVH